MPEVTISFQGIIALKLDEDPRSDAEGTTYDHVRVIVPRIRKGASARDGSYIGRHTCYLKVPDDWELQSLDSLHRTPPYMRHNEKFKYVSLMGYQVEFELINKRGETVNEGRVGWRKLDNPDALIRLNPIVPEAVIDPRLLQNPAPLDVAARMTLNGGSLLSNLAVNARVQVDKFGHVRGDSPAYDLAKPANKVKWHHGDVDKIRITLTRLRPQAQTAPGFPDSAPLPAPDTFERDITADTDIEISNECEPALHHIDTDYKWFYNLLPPDKYHLLDEEIDLHGLLPAPIVLAGDGGEGSSETCYPAGIP